PAPGAVQPALPVRDGRTREHFAPEAREARDRPHPHGSQPARRGPIMSESETQNTENTETGETDVETAEQPSGSQPTEVPAAAEPSPEAVVGDADAPRGG